MSSPHEHTVHTLTGAYALHALDGPERREFEAHLAECPDCVREVDELRATAARMAFAAAQTPPARLRGRVMEEVAITRQDPPAVTRLSDARRRAAWPRGRLAVRLTAAAAAVATAAAAVLGVLTVRAERERDAARAELAQAQAEYRPVSELAAAPDARGGTGAGVNGGTAFVLASHRLDRAVLLASDLPAPPTGHTYQAWLIGNGQPRSVGLVAAPPRATSPPLVFAGLDGAHKIGLTVEPSGGSPQPTTTPVVLFDLPS